MKRLRLKQPPPVSAFAAPTTLDTIRRAAAHNALDARLAPIDRWLWRWAASQGSGFKSSDIPRTQVPPLTPVHAIQTDEVILSAPYNWDSFIHSWYRSEKSAEQIGELMGMGRTAVYSEHKIVLGYLLGQLRAVGLIIPQYPGL